MCSIYEMMPIALLEALATGLPCLTHMFPVADWMRGAGGESVDMQEAGALAQALTRLLADAPLRRKYAAAARGQCEAMFATDKVVGKIIDYYDFVRAQ